jgi:Domain of unknown function (DUF4410)
VTRFHLLLAALAVAGCAKGHVTATETVQTGLLPRPAQVVVSDFAVRPEEVKLDRGVSAQLQRAASSDTPSEKMMEAARATQAALTQTLVKKLVSYGLPAAPIASGVVPPPGSLLVQGQIVSVDEGNRTRRTLIGLGAGKSSVSADAQLYYAVDPAQPLFLQSFTGEADSGRAPGAAETMGVGAATDRIVTSAAMTAGTHAVGEVRHTSDEANADKLAEALAKQIGTYAVGQGWISPAALR